MKKTFTLVASLLLGISAFAQSSLVFTNAAGDVVPDGSVLTVTDYQLNETDDMQLHSGLYVKNAGETAAFVGMIVKVTEIGEASFNHCFPGSCSPVMGPLSEDKLPKVIDKTGMPFGMAAGVSADIESELNVIDGEYATCTAVYSLIEMEMVDVDSYGMPVYDQKCVASTVTVNYVYNENSKEVAGVNGICDDSAKSAVTYNLFGQRVEDGYKGIVIKNGKKIMQ